ncbi:AAA family ATPase [Vibrio sp. 14N.309.X.WAT.E.F5]|uniref:AAA family ATPase n=1 Tax=Vibrio sp. 14N.309.X.WAT.E.F5 TaxID=2998321 RepID=UPI0025AF08C5|nr:AAA family ATPase [Vibrio sp. 14N.309.X.WAT.E.F5]MDN2668889.1 AAA family ATPase [Vibrio sp. 14N.309.X.WAT.E.F5]
MNNFRIGRLLVKNFKSYTEEFLYNFENQDLIILDGPNGFGKTTIFDAIEVALTGTVSRFKESKIIDTKTKNKNMLISTNGVDGASAFVVLELIDDNNNRLIIGSYIEAKKGRNKEWSNHIYRGFLKCWPDNVDDIPNEIEKENNDIDKQLQEALGFKELNKMFTVFNYIQQEESLHFLKLDEKSRFKQIGHLFGINDEKESLNQLEELKSVVSVKITELEKEKTGKKLEIEELITDENVSDEIDLSGSTIKHLDENTITLVKLGKYKDSLEECKQILTGEGGDKWTNIKKRYEVKKFLKDDNRSLVENLLVFSKTPRFSYIESLSNHIDWVTNTINKCNDYSDLKKLDISEEINITEDLLNKIKKYFIGLYEINEDAINNYNVLVNAQSTTEQVLTSITNSSETLIKKLNKYFGEEEEIIEYSNHLEDVNCPLCGQSYDDLVEINKAYIEQKSVFEKLKTDTGKNLQLAYEKIIDNLISPVIQRSKARFDKYSHFNDNYKEILRGRQVSKDSFDEMLKVKTWFDDNLPKYREHSCPSLLSSDYSVENKYNEIRKLLENLDNDLSVKVDDKFEDIKGKLDHIGVDANTEVRDWPLSLENVKNDIKYMENKIKLLNNSKYKEINNKISEYDKELSNYINILNALGEGCKIYKNNISRYEKDIAKKIQIPFYNISSKILQTRIESGVSASGVILETPDKLSSNGYYRFCSSVGAEHDAWSTMSSGQLAGVVIAFMLAMNKVFPTGLKTLLIDDPIQSMDDINMASFIQLLREEFKGYQIIMSTHESRIANYVSYKYQTSGLNPLAINLKNEKRNRELN